MKTNWHEVDRIDFEFKSFNTPFGEKIKRKKGFILRDAEGNGRHKLFNTEKELEAFVHSSWSKINCLARAHVEVMFELNNGNIKYELVHCYFGETCEKAGCKLCNTKT